MPDLPEWSKVVALPLLLGFLTTVIGMFFGYLSDYIDRRKQLRLRELERAQKIHDDVVLSLDRLFNHLKWDAWYIAMRRVKFSADEGKDKALKPWNDNERWVLYKDALDNWRSNDLLFTSQVRAYFPNREIDGTLVSPADMICEISELVNKAAWNVWKLYWEEKFCTGSVRYSKIENLNECAVPHVAVKFATDTTNNNEADEKNELEVSTTRTFNTKGRHMSTFKTIQEYNAVQRVDDLMGLTEDEKEGKKFFDNILAKVDKVFGEILSIMIYDIQQENVGKLSQYNTVSPYVSGKVKRK